MAPATALAALTREGMAAGAVPRGLIEGAARAATRVATRARPPRLALTEGVIKIMLLKKLTLSAAILCGAILVAWAATAAMIAGDDEDRPAGKPRPAGGAGGSGPCIPDRTPSRSMIRERSALHGRVLDPDGKPVAGARVWLNDQIGQQRPVEARTDADGRFRLGPIEPQYRNRFV